MGEKKKAAHADHRALYRTYRSKKLSEVVGQEHITKTLENALSQGKLSHAYLFTGPRGTGKTSVARILAHEINKLPYEDESIHLDIVEIDAASNRRIDDIRDLRDKVHIAPVSAKYKVYIIDEVHMLTTESFNALLKTLEEPPAHVIFILATTEAHKLPATIISRTQRHSFRLIPLEKIVEHLTYIAKQEKITIDQSALKLLAAHGGGSFRDSISLLDQMSTHTEPIDATTVEQLLGLAPQEALGNLLQVVLAGDGRQILVQVQQLLENGLTAASVATQLLQLLRENALQGNHTDIAGNLMAELLSVSTSQYPQLKLETILLSVQPAHAMNTSEVAPVSTKPTVIPSQKKAEPEVPVTAKPEASEVEESPQAPTEPISRVSAKPQQSGKIELETHWPNVIERTKQKNNSLYTVLRLATPELDEQGLLLIFSFPFHQKKVEESRYKALIAEIVEEVSGVSVAVRSIVDKTRAKPVTASSKPLTDPAHASLISSVQDIMGGGEIVNV